MKEYDVNVYVHIRGVVMAESDDESDILEALFPDGWEGEVEGVSTDPNYLPRGHITPTGVSDDDDDEDDEDDF